MQRGIYLLIICVLLLVTLTGCFAATQDAERNGSSGDGTLGTEIPGDDSREKLSTEEAFVTWDKNIVIPFVFCTRDLQNLVDVYYLGLWDLKEGKVSFEEKPLFSARGTYEMCWDGGGRFGFLPAVPHKFSLTVADPRIHADVIQNVTMVEPSPLIACPSDGGTFLVYQDENKNLVLDIRDHPLAGKVVLETELAPRTVLSRGVSVQASADEVRVYCETSRLETREVDGSILDGTVHGILEVRYVPSAIKPQIWRTIHPDIGVTEPEAGTTFTQCGNRLFIGNGMASTTTLDLLTGKIEPFNQALDELRKLDPNYVRSGPDEIEPMPDRTFTYAGYVVLGSSYMVGGEDSRYVHHFIAFKGDQIMGRLWFDGKNLKVFKGRDETFDMELPGASGSVGEIRFPVEMQKLESLSSAWARAFGPNEFDAIWLRARYPDVFNETLRCDGWTAEEMSVVLMKRFEENPCDFIRALGDAPLKEADLVGQLLAYNAGQGLDTFRKKLENLKAQLSGEKEKKAVDIILKQIDDFKKMGR